MGFYFVNIIHSNMLLLCVLISTIGLINMTFSYKGALKCCEELLKFMEGYASQRKSGAMSGP